MPPDLGGLERRAVKCETVVQATQLGIGQASAAQRLHAHEIFLVDARILTDQLPRDAPILRQHEQPRGIDIEPTGGRILLVDRLPAGLEIENPRIVDSGDLKSFAWLKTTLKPQHSEFRDDRFVAAFDRTSSQSAFFHVAYIVRAVAPGTYMHPPAVVEDMYRPERFGRTGFGTADAGPSGASKNIGWIVALLAVGIVGFLFVSTGGWKEARAKLKRFAASEFANFIGPKLRRKRGPEKDDSGGNG